LHSFSGLGLANEKENDLYWKIMKNQYARHRWQSVEVLVIDEGLPLLQFTSSISQSTNVYFICRIYY
jgi:hypothetical protein